MEIQLVLVSFVAGLLTVLAPCIFPLLPILLGTSAGGKEGRAKAFTVIASLLASITVLTLLIYGSSNILNIEQGTLRAISAVIIILVGLVLLFPHGWELISQKVGLRDSSNKFLGRAMKKDGKAGDVLVGVALGPVFSSCSPTYAIIIATILPQDPVTGTIYLLWYVLGLGVVLSLIAILGSKFVSKLQWATDPDGWFRRSIGGLFVLIGVAVVFNGDRAFEAWVLQLDFYDSLTSFELQLSE